MWTDLGHRTVIGALAMAVGLLVLTTAPALAAGPDLTIHAVDDMLPFQEAEETMVETTTTSSSHPQWVEDIEAKTWEGFMTGMDGFDEFVPPVGMPLYFEDPFISTDLRLLYIYHTIPDGSVLRGGEVHVAAAQIRLALTERLAFIAWKDGYSWVDSGITTQEDGWNDLGIGAKYALYADPQEQFIFTGGLKWELDSGSREAFQGRTDEITPFLSVAKGWDKLHLIGAFSYRIPTDFRSATSSLVANLHLDYELWGCFYPLIELHGIYWVSNADKLPFSQDYLDVGSLGSAEAAGSTFFSAGVGFRWEIIEDLNFGATYEFPLQDADDHLQEHRVTINTVISF
jgi:hypothetical protein